MGEIIVWPKPSTPLPFTGERLTTAYGGQTEIEHLHRYLMAREWCRDKDVLDVASGEGYGTALLAQVARSAVGVEIALDAVDHANRAYKAENLSFLVGDARSLPNPDAAFDVVTSFETIEHFAEQQLFLSEIRRVLRPGGLLIVSTPDRDNYSPAESAANPFHVRELDREEFDLLLRSYFAEVSLLLQRPIFGSALLPSGGGKATPLCFERRGDGHFEGSLNLPRPQYVVAFASDHPISLLPPSLYIDTGRLGMLRPSEADAQLRLLREKVATELEPLRTELSVLRAELSASREQATSLSAAHHAPADAQEEVKGLVAANEMAERARHELASAREEVKGLVAANEMAERACALVRHQLVGAREEAKRLATAKETAETATEIAGRTVESLRSQLAECQQRLLHERAAKRRIWPARAWRELRRFGRRLRRSS
jgi:SAM-dependent methyltransferase